MVESVLLLSRTDYRTDDRAAIHHLANALTSLFAEVNFVSVAFSRHTRKSRDGRHGLLHAANRWEMVDGVGCFLWTMPWHPISAGGKFTRMATAPAFDLWAKWPCRELDEAAARADIIIVQSGPAAALIARLRHHAPKAKIIYFAADLLSSAGVHPRVQAILERDSDLVDRVIVIARAMLTHFPAFGDRVEFVPLGLDSSQMFGHSKLPDLAGSGVVADGSINFDPAVIQIAASSLPNTQFHIFGVSSGNRYPANVREHGAGTEAEFTSYLRHANVGVAAHIDTPHAERLVDASIPLMRFGDLGVPAVCPSIAVGDKPLRFGYEAGRSASVKEAFARALRVQPGGARIPALTWSDVARNFGETRPRSSRMNLPVMSPRALKVQHGK